jgi:hypothetical protein
MPTLCQKIYFDMRTNTDNKINPQFVLVQIRSSTVRLTDTRRITNNQAAIYRRACGGS